jgi:nitrogen fixation protein NifU and related proteins
MPNLRELYQQIIIDHSQHPKNFRILEHSKHVQEGYNPLCGDKIIIYVNDSNGRIEDIAFQGSGCAISIASASLMTEAIKGKTLEEVTALFQEFQEIVTKGDLKNQTKLGKLAVLAGVSAYPMRVKCATLPWHTLKAALTSNTKSKVTTE